MNKQEQLEAIMWYQTVQPFHPLTCGNDSSHELLVGWFFEDGEVGLGCPTCGYTQEWVPEDVFHFYANREFYDAIYG